MKVKLNPKTRLVFG